MKWWKCSSPSSYLKRVFIATYGAPIILILFLLGKGEFAQAVAMCPDCPQRQQTIVSKGFVGPRC